MKFIALFAAILLSPLAAAENAFLNERDDLLGLVERQYTARSWLPRFEPRGPLQARQACMATCSNGGCCNTGGPCTTDGYCCPSGGIACSDGGCCRAGETCTTTNGTQTCQTTQGCAAPVVSCGSSCCDAGMKCVTVTGGQYRCQATTTADPATSSTVGPPVLGDGTLPKSKNSSASASNHASASATGSGSKAAAVSASATGKSAGSASASSASGQVLSVSGLQMVFNILAGVGVLATLVLVY